MSGEDDFIARHFAPLAGPGGLGLRDDAALLVPPPGCDLVVTADAIVAGVHFFADDPPGDIARKSLRVNLSDLAAKGASPLAFLLTLMLPRAFAEDDVATFASALGDDAREYGCPLLGGDTVSTPGPLSISITAIGSVPHGRMVRRDGVKAGDLLYVTGTIGDAALGLAALQAKLPAGMLTDAARDFLIGRYRRPLPRLALASPLQDYASAAMDVSDGLAGDLEKMLSLASLSATVPFARVPLSPAARSCVSMAPAFHQTILAGGDDYEIICAVPPDRRTSFEAAAASESVVVTFLGTAAATVPARVIFTNEDGRALQLDRLSYSHV